MTLLEVQILCPDDAVADAIAARLLEVRLAACCNRGASVHSAYRWRGALESATEVPLVVKTRTALFDALCRVVKDLHPYEVPAITATLFGAVDDEYAAWVLAETADSADPRE